MNQLPLPEKTRGFTLIEILIVTAILALLITATVVFIVPSLNRGRDGRRKADLQRISTALEEYYNNKLSYPAAVTSCGTGSELAEVLKDVPCDVITKQPYLYIADPVGCGGTASDRCSGYRLLTDLAYDADPDIEEKGCVTDFSGVQGCHQEGSTVYDYGVAVGRGLAD